MEVDVFESQASANCSFPWRVDGKKTIVIKHQTTPIYAAHEVPGLTLRHAVIALGTLKVTVELHPH